MNMRTSLAAEAQQRVVLLALAQQHVPAREPVTGLELAVDAVVPLLVHVDPALLDLSAGLALRLDQFFLHHSILERKVISRQRRRVNLPPHGVLTTFLHVAGFEFTE